MGSLFVLLAFVLVGSIFLGGYGLRLIRNVVRGVPHPLPEWDDLGGMFSEGLVAFGMYLVYIIPAIAGFVVLGIVVGVSSGDDGPGGIAAITGSALLMVLLAFAMLALVLYLPSAMTRLALTQRFSAGFEFEENFAFIRRNLGNYLLAIVIYFIASFAAQFSILLFCIGIIPGMFWQICVNACAFGEVALRDPERQTAFPGAS